MHELRTSSLAWVGLWFVGACSSASSGFDTGRDPVVGADSSAETEEDYDSSSSSENGGSLGELADKTNGTASGDPTPPDGKTPSNDPATPHPASTDNATSSDGAQAGPTTPNGSATPAGDGFWALVRSDDSFHPQPEEWVYDAQARLVRSREIRLRRDPVPFYAVDTTITYDGDRVRVVHDAEPEDVTDITEEYELDAGRVVSLTTSHDGEPNRVTTFEYDEMRRLVASRELYLPDSETVWTLSWRAGEDPMELARDGEVVCAYGWRHLWLGTECYIDGRVSQTYQPDAGGRLGLMTYEDGTWVSFSYDDAGRLTRQESLYWFNEIDYTADGKLLATRESTADEAYIYDDLGLLREVQRRYGTDRVTTTFEYQRVSDDTVIETETSPDQTVVRTYQRLSRPPVGLPQVPSFWTLLRMDQPLRYIAPPDYSNVPW